MGEASLLPIILLLALEHVPLPSWIRRGAVLASIGASVAQFSGSNAGVAAYWILTLLVVLLLTRSLFEKGWSSRLRVGAVALSWPAVCSTVIVSVIDPQWVTREADVVGLFVLSPLALVPLIAVSYQLTLNASWRRETEY